MSLVHMCYGGSHTKVMVYIYSGGTHECHDVHVLWGTHECHGAHVLWGTHIMGDTHECHWCTCIMGAHESHGAHVESEDSLKESVLSVLCGLSGSTGHLYSLSLLADPAFLSLKFY